MRALGLAMVLIILFQFLTISLKGGRRFDSKGHQRIHRFQKEWNQ